MSLSLTYQSLEWVKAQLMTLTGLATTRVIITRDMDAQELTASPTIVLAPLAETTELETRSQWKLGIGILVAIVYQATDATEDNQYLLREKLIGWAYDNSKPKTLAGAVKMEIDTGGGLLNECLIDGSDAVFVNQFELKIWFLVARS